MCVSAIVWLAILAISGLVVYEIRKVGTKRTKEIAAEPKPPHVPVWADLARCEVHKDGTITTPDYWVCDCREVRPATLLRCPQCFCSSDAAPDADLCRVAELVGSKI
jgi:hypothetical protein